MDAGSEAEWKPPSAARSDGAESSAILRRQYSTSASTRLPPGRGPPRWAESWADGAKSACLGGVDGAGDDREEEEGRWCRPSAAAAAKGVGEVRRLGCCAWLVVPGGPGGGALAGAWTPLKSDRENGGDREDGGGGDSSWALALRRRAESTAGLLLLERRWASDTRESQARGDRASGGAAAPPPPPTGADSSAIFFFQKSTSLSSCVADAEATRMVSVPGEETGGSASNESIVLMREDTV